jgi:16S rRNA (adenine1518-N6/adenine1519-N6)-dimethyltransferase
VTSTLLGAAAIRALAAELGLHPSKRLGQNFVIDPNTVQRIVRLAEVAPSQHVLEVGPGLGSLTLALLEQGAEVTAIELDANLARRLPQTVQERLGRVPLRVIVGDALRLEDVPGEPTSLVANLPYNVAVPVLLHLLALLPSLRTGLVMVQREVAERLAASPGTKAYGVPSVKARWFAEVEVAGDVPRFVFWPVPNVDSGLVRLRQRAAPVCRSTREQVFEVVDAAFAQRRKTLRSSLAGLCGSAAVAGEALVLAEVDPMLRGEALDVADFARLADAIAIIVPGSPRARQQVDTQGSPD